MIRLGNGLMASRKQILPLPEPIALRREAAAAYVGLSAGHFDKTVDEGVMPQPIDLSGVKVWPCLALQRALDPEAFAPVSSWDED